jgi:tRNA nucleotidyltransferase/poly(A) polymerase
MKLRDILALMYKIHKESGISMPYITGGVPRDKILGLIKDEISDLDITTGDASVHNLAKEFSIALGHQYSIDSKQMDDGHTSVFVGDFKIDFSSNFEVPHVEQLLSKRGIKNINDTQKEMFSRDFTCNALLMTLDLKKIKDPTKQGFLDIKNKILRTCLDPSITLKYNPNRIIRVIYLASKLGFDVDPEIISWISKNKEFIRMSPEGYLAKNLDKALSKDPDRAIHLITKMNLWDTLPITDSLYPYYAKKSVKEAQLRPNYDYGEGLYMNLDRYKSVSDFRRKRRKKRMRQIKKIKNMKLK